MTLFVLLNILICVFFEKKECNLHLRVLMKLIIGGSDGKASAYNAGDSSSILRLGRSPWRRKWQPTPVFLPGKSHGWRSPVGLQLMGSQRVGHDWATSLSLSLFMITWTTALSISKKLWAMPCRATQEGRVMVGSFEKCSPMEKEMANHFSILVLRTPWTVWKGKKIRHWKMNSPGW